MLDLDTKPEATAPGTGERPEGWRFERLGDAHVTMADRASCPSGRERNHFQRKALGMGINPSQAGRQPMPYPHPHRSPRDQGVREGPWGGVRRGLFEKARN